ncbi:MAG: DUF4375 domain-containing protein [Bacillota bacterium]|nr:DUF4375 domain-containing protein [Bacillota bacterium]
MNKKTKIIGIIGISVLLGAFVLGRVKEKVDDFNQSPTKQMWDLYKVSEKISQTPLKELLNQEITDTTIDEVYLRLCDLCEDGYKLNQINEYQRNFWLVYNFNGETGNGGIEQFLYNCHDQIDITLQTLQDVHLENSIRYLAESKEIYPEKIEMYSNDEITEKLNQKDDTYYDESEKECYAFLFQYLKENKEYFMKES